MNEAKHTKGPWFTGHRGTEELWVGPDHQSLFVCTVAWECDDSRSNARANARLIAAAPELLEALQSSTHRKHDMPDGPCLCSQCAFVTLRDAAIAKVTGA